MTLDYIIKFFFVMLLMLPIYLLIRRPWKKRELREVFLAAFWLYLGGLLALTLNGTYQYPHIMISDAIDRIKVMKNINIIPFGVIPVFFNEQNKKFFMINIVGNIIMFMPWGFGIPLLWKKNQHICKVAAFSLGITVMIEFSQLFIWRQVDIDDIILNFTGGMIGGLFYFNLAKVFPKIKEFSK